MGLTVASASHVAKIDAADCFCGISPAKHEIFRYDAAHAFFNERRAA